MFGVARGAVSVSGLLPTIIAFVTTAIAIINDLPQRFWWADGVIVFSSFAAILIIRALGTTTFFGLATDPAGPARSIAPGRRWWLRRCWDRLAGNTGTGSERLSAWIYLFNIILVGLIALNLVITKFAPPANPHNGDPATTLQAIGKETEALKKRVKDQAAEIDSDGAQIKDLTRWVSQFENMAPPGTLPPRMIPGTR